VASATQRGKANGRTAGNRPPGRRPPSISTGERGGAHVDRWFRAAKIAGDRTGAAWRRGRCLRAGRPRLDTAGGPGSRPGGRRVQLNKRRAAGSPSCADPKGRNRLGDDGSDLAGVPATGCSSSTARRRSFNGDDPGGGFRARGTASGTGRSQCTDFAATRCGVVVRDGPRARGAPLADPWTRRAWPARTRAMLTCRNQREELTESRRSRPPGGVAG